MTDASGTIGEYWYDGDGRRVKKSVPATGEVTVFVYDAMGRLIQEHSTVVQTGSDAKIVYTTNDALGSPRVSTDGIGSVISRHDYHPFGEEVSRSGYGSDTIRKQFTGYERDGETGLDFAQARYFSSGFGRFSSPDPVYIEMKRLVDPQQINIYLYARNNPLKFTDVTGLDIEIVGDEQQWGLERLKNGLSFANQVTLSKNKVAITDKDGRVLDPTKKADKKILDKMAKGLKDAEKDLFKAIIDTKTQATLTVVKSSTDVDIGENKSPGNNSVDRSEAELFDQGKGAGGGLNSSGIVKHEAMEAYLTAKTGKPIVGVGADPSPHTNNPFPGLRSFDFSAPVGSRIASYSATLPGFPGSYYVQKQLVTPIPAVGLPQKAGTITSVVYVKP